MKFITTLFGEPYEVDTPTRAKAYTEGVREYLKAHNLKGKIKPSKLLGFCSVRQVKPDLLEVLGGLHASNY